MTIYDFFNLSSALSILTALIFIAIIVVGIIVANQIRLARKSPALQEPVTSFSNSAGSTTSGEQDESWLAKPDFKGGSESLPKIASEENPVEQLKKKCDYGELLFYAWCLNNPEEKLRRSVPREKLLKICADLNRLFDLTNDPKVFELLIKYLRVLDSDRVASSVRHPKDP